jgi:hypothetical protein
MLFQTRGCRIKKILAESAGWAADKSRFEKLTRDGYHIRLHAPGDVAGRRDNVIQI